MYDLEKLFNKAGKLNAAIIRRDTFKNSELCKYILSETKNLIDVSLLQRLHHIKNSIKDIPKCVVCNEYAHFNPWASQYGDYSLTCNSRSCISKHSAEKRSNTMIKKYGSLVSENHISKNQTAIENFVNKSKITIHQKYGVTNVSHIPGINDKKKNTLLQRYNVNHPSQIAKVKQKKNETSTAFFQSLTDKVTVLDLDKNNKSIYFSCNVCEESLQQSLHTETFKWRARKLGSPCPICSGLNIGSALQKQVIDYISSIYSGKIEVNNRIILDGLELDIVLPDLKIAIEVNGIFWHSCNKEEDKEYKFYHANKTNLCLEKGVRLIHIFEDTWIFKQQIIKDRIKSLLNPQKIFARKCVLVDLTVKEERDFLNSNHIQGYVASSAKKGLLFNNEIVAIMTIGKSRFDKQSDYEMLRFCSKGGTIVVGGASKLLKALVKEVKPTALCSYSDRLWGDGNLYKTLGFSYKGVSQPNYRWTKSMQSLSRYETQKHKLNKVLTNFDANLTEAENMFRNGWRRVWDCGNTKWSML